MKRLICQYRDGGNYKTAFEPFLVPDEFVEKHGIEPGGLYQKDIFAEYDEVQMPSPDDEGWDDDLDHDYVEVCDIEHVNDTIETLQKMYGLEWID